VRALRARALTLGDVGALHEHARDLAAGLVDDRLEHEVDAAFDEHAVGIEHLRRHRAADEGTPGQPHLVEQLDVAAPVDARQRAPQRPADEAAAADQRFERAVRELVDVVVPAQHRHEAGRLVEQPAKRVQLALVHEPGDHAPGHVDA
jgi:hypothetical protein